MRIMLPGGLSFEPSTGVLERDGTHLARLSPQQSGIFAALAKALGSCLPHERLMRAGGMNDPRIELETEQAQSILKVQIHNIRRRILNSGLRIENVHYQGYFLTADNGELTKGAFYRRRKPAPQAGEARP